MRRQEALFCFFLYLGVLWLSEGEAWWGGAESLIYIFIPGAT